jgi:AraC-like DNA-binding protein
MSWMEHRRSNLSVQAISQLLGEEGYDPAACLDGTGLSPATVMDAQIRISDETEIAIIEKALAILPKKAGYGIRVGRSLRVTTFGIWGLAIMASPRFRDAFETVARFSELSFLLSKVRLDETEGISRAVIEMHRLPDSIHRFLFERYYAGSTTFLREMMPDLDQSPFELRLPFEDVEYARELSQVTGRKVMTGQADYALAMPSDWLDQPLPQADPIAHAHFVGQCEAMLRERQELPDHAGKVRDFIIRRGSYAPRLGDVASGAGMSARSFRRRLEAEGTSFTEVVLQTRMALARELLSTAGLSVSIVAHKLGYSETASFSRAYTKWWGQNPRQARTEGRSAPQ